MPSDKTHLAKAEENYAFLKSINKDDWVKKNYPDWYITIIFYVSVHVMDAYLPGGKLYPTNHGMRRDYLDKSLGVSDITVISHKELERLSRIGRYLSNSGETTLRQLIPKDISDADVAFEEIKRFCKSKFSLELK